MALYRLSYISKLRGQDLNLRPSGYEPDELPTAPPRGIHLHPQWVMEGTGFEPVKAQLTDLQSVPFGQLGYPSKGLSVFRFRPADEIYNTMVFP